MPKKSEELEHNSSNHGRLQEVGFHHPTSPNTQIKALPTCLVKHKITYDLRNANVKLGTLKQ